MTTFEARRIVKERYPKAKALKGKEVMNPRLSENFFGIFDDLKNQISPAMWKKAGHAWIDAAHEVLGLPTKAYYGN